jgi:hypothetical protein
MALDTGKMAEKITATAKYHTETLTQLHNNPQNKSQIIKNGLNIVGQYFGFYMDNLARRDSASFHHIYENDRIGNPDARLFYYTITAGSGSPGIRYTLRDATVPENSGQVFRKRAFVMESGNPVTIRPKSGKYLAFDVDGEKVFTKKSYVPNPGGTAVSGSFVRAFNAYMNVQASVMLEDVGFYDKINQETFKESEVALSRISSGNLNSSGMAKESANRIARRSK